MANLGFTDRPDKPVTRVTRGLTVQLDRKVIEVFTAISEAMERREFGYALFLF